MISAWILTSRIPLFRQRNFAERSEHAAGQVECNPRATKFHAFPRIKLVLNEFGKALGRKILRSSDKGVLYAGKYLFYVDMIAFRELGQSMTGASYAAMPHGPQLDNYRDLVDSIQAADEKEAEPLTDQEKRIIRRIARAFPDDQSVYKAVHMEEVFREKKPGGHILYPEAELLRQI